METDKFEISYERYESLVDSISSIRGLVRALARIDGIFPGDSIAEVHRLFLPEIVFPHSFSVEDLPENLKPPYDERAGPSSRMKQLRKKMQINGLVNLAGLVVEDNDVILDLCCGAGYLTRALAHHFTDCCVLGVDKNAELIEKAEKQARKWGIENAFFQEGDIYELKPRYDFSVVTALHSCGAEADRVIDIGIESMASIVCAPCCYSKINTKDTRKELRLPRSRALSWGDLQGEYLEFLKATRALERDSGDTPAKIMFDDLHRLIVNYDRLLYLEEHGFNVAYAPFTPRVFKSEGRTNKSHFNTPHNYAIVAKPGVLA